MTMKEVNIHRQELDTVPMNHINLFVQIFCSAAKKKR